MDLESYALTAAQDIDRSSKDESAERADVKGKGKQREQQDVTATGLKREEGEKEEDITLEADVKHLANSVSSWWSGFSKRTQEQLASAQSHISEQGGIVQFARNEAARIEKSIEEVRREALARSQSQAQAQERGEEAAAPPSAAAASNDGGEGKGRSNEADADATADAPAEATSTSSSSLPLPSTNPQIAHLQSQITTRLSTLFSSSPPSSTNLTSSVQSALHDVSTSLRQLGGSESKALAQRYLEASRELVGKAGDEWRDMVGELVKIVPPPGVEAGDQAAVATAKKEEAVDVKVASEKGTATATSSDASPVHASSASASALQPPPSEQKDEDAFSWEDGGVDGSDSRDSSAGKGAPASASASASAGKDGVAEKEKTNEKAKAAEESDDSDWE